MQRRPWLWTNRFISSHILTPFLAKTPVTPNQITIMNIFFGVVSGIFFSLGGYESALWGVAFYEIAYLLDNCDGEIARLKNRTSELGAKLDIISDVITDFAFFIGIFAGAGKQNIAGPLGFLFGAAILGLIAHYAIIMIEKMKGFGPAEPGQADPEGAKRYDLISEALNAFSAGEISWIVVILGIAGLVYWLVWVIPIYINAIWIINLVRNFKWIK